jgi:hypothetical protein
MYNLMASTIAAGCILVPQCCAIGDERAELTRDLNEFAYLPLVGRFFSSLLLNSQTLKSRLQPADEQVQDGNFSRVYRIFAGP